MSSPSAAVVMIDLQAGFASCEGSLASANGTLEIQPIQDAVKRCALFLENLPLTTPRVFIRAEYMAGQFVNGNMNASLAYLCVPGSNIDCEWADDIAGHVNVPSARVITKHEHSGCSQPNFCRDVLTFAQQGVKSFFFGGVLAEYCVIQTVLDTHELLVSNGYTIRSDHNNDLLTSKSTTSSHSGERQSNAPTTTTAADTHRDDAKWGEQGVAVTGNEAKVIQLVVLVDLVASRRSKVAARETALERLKEAGVVLMSSDTHPPIGHNAKY